MIRVQSINGVAVNGNSCYNRANKEALSKKKIGESNPDLVVHISEESQKLNLKHRDPNQQS